MPLCNLCSLFVLLASFDKCFFLDRFPSFFFSGEQIVHWYSHFHILERPNIQLLSYFSARYSNLAFLNIFSYLYITLYGTFSFISFLFILSYVTFFNQNVVIDYIMIIVAYWFIYFSIVH